MTEVDDAVRTVIQASLGGQHDWGEPLHLSSEGWKALCSRLFAGKVPGLLADVVQAGEAVAVDDSARAQLLDQMVVRLMNDLRAESECLRVTELLRRVGIDSVVLKGLAVAHLDYADPSHR